jgi:TonB-linked SusC/RagA family outer membrane protein
MVKDSNRGTVANAEGLFELRLAGGSFTLVFSYLGYESQEVQVTIPVSDDLNIEMQDLGLPLDMIEVVSTGYQKIPKERATGSFAFLDNELVDRRVSTNILDRLEDVTPGLVFNRGIGAVNERISIRGRSTLFANTQPLIVVDNFPYDGPIENINPNDVETITVLKDAAAASIWGAQAGNGVIVITTKNARQVGKPVFAFNSNVTVGEQPDLFYRPQMSISDYIEVERMNFQAGRYTARENSNNRTVLPPTVEAMIRHRKGEISDSELEQLLDGYKSNDSRSDLMKHYYRPSVFQQYAMSLNGGGDYHHYTVSLGWDNNLGNTIGNRDQRITANILNNWSLLSNKLKIGVGLYAVGGQQTRDTELPEPYPYDRFLDESGNPLPIVRGYSSRFIQSIENSGLLDWRYVPLADIGTNPSENQSTDIRLNSTISYDLGRHLKASVQYQYWQNTGLTKSVQTKESYFARNLINQFTQVNPDGTFSNAVPMGGILNAGQTAASSHHGRIQLNYDRKFSHKHQVAALAGYEVKVLDSESRSYVSYGYNDELGLSIPVNFAQQYRRFHNQSLALIPNSENHTGFSDRYISYFANMSYTYMDRYILSGSARKDASNLFGVDANQRGLPLWSAGLGWIISSEEFMNSDWLPYLKLRSTYGYNGNVDKTVTAYTTAVYQSGNNNFLTGLPFAVPGRASNPELRWEKINIINLGLDFELKNRMLGGSIEVFQKKGIDLIGDFAISPSSGFLTARGNFADTRTNGVDIALNSHILNRKFKWIADVFFSMADEKVTNYATEPSPLSFMATSFSGIVMPFSGWPLRPMLSLPWAGLNPDNGEPMGFLDGEPSNNYSAIINNLSMEDMIFHGSIRPIYFGSIRNSFQYGGFSLSMNISYRLKYFYRRETVSYSSLMQGTIGHPDYANRWQNPGDELQTTVPSMPSGLNSIRDTFYLYSEDLVERGDHFRLQDIRVAYTWSRQNHSRIPFRNAQLYAYVNNIGILWKMSDDPIDPDFRTLPLPRTIALGLKVDF